MNLSAMLQCYGMSIFPIPHNYLIGKYKINLQHRKNSEKCPYVKDLLQIFTQKKDIGAWWVGLAGSGGCG